MKPNNGATEGPGRLPAVQGAKHPPELQALLLAAEGAGPDVQERIVRAYYAEMEGAPNSVVVYQSVLLAAVYNAIRHDVKNAAAALPVSDAELFANRSALFANGGEFRYAPL